MSVRINASFRLTGFDTSQIKARIPVILRNYDRVIFPAFKEEISKAQFYWPNITARTGKAALKNARTQGLKVFNVVEVESPRDIVDTGAFRASQLRETTGPFGLGLTYTWGGPKAPYAPLILTGYTSRNGTRYPARDWIKPALEAHPLDRFFADQWARLAARRL